MNLRHDDGELLGDVGGEVEEVAKLLAVGDDVHGGSGEDVTRADEDGESSTHSVCCPAGSGSRCFPP